MRPEDVPSSGEARCPDCRQPAQGCSLTSDSLRAGVPAPNGGAPRASGLPVRPEDVPSSGEARCPDCRQPAQGRSLTSDSVPSVWLELHGGAPRASLAVAAPPGRAERYPGTAGKPRPCAPQTRRPPSLPSVGCDGPSAAASRRALCRALGCRSAGKQSGGKQTNLGSRSSGKWQDAAEKTCVGVC